MWKLELPRRSLRVLWGYLLPVTTVGAAVAATFALGPAMRHTPTLFFCAVMLSSRFGGVWPGIFAGLLSALALDYYFIPPLHALGIRLDEIPDMIAFVSSAWFVSWLSGEQQRAKHSLKQASDELEATVQQRTAELVQTNRQLLREIAERKLAEDGLIRAHAEMARVVRVMTMGELAASIAHELNQPLTGVILNANVCLRWLARQPPDFEEARQAGERTVQDATRAGEVLVRVRRLLMKRDPLKECVDIHEVIREMIALTQGELRRHTVFLRTEFAAGLPEVVADRIELQQLLLNLFMNAIEAMDTVPPETRVLCIRTGRAGPGTIEVLVQDSGTGLTPEQWPRIFESFYTTKREGIGMGLTISRSIVEAHGGQLSVVGNDGPGTTFRFNLPTNGVLTR